MKTWKTWTYLILAFSTLIVFSTAIWYVEDTPDASSLRPEITTNPDFEIIMAPPISELNGIHLDTGTWEVDPNDPTTFFIRADADWVLKGRPSVNLDNAGERPYLKLLIGSRVYRLYLEEEPS